MGTDWSKVYDEGRGAGGYNRAKQNHLHKSQYKFSWEGMGGIKKFVGTT